MNVSICALKGDPLRNKPPEKCFQSYKVTRITKKREQEELFPLQFFQVAMTSLSSSSLDTSL